MEPATVRGCAYIVTVAVIWVGASYLVSGLEAGGLPPFLLTYVANSLFALYLPLVWALDRLGRRRGTRLPSEEPEARPSCGPADEAGAPPPGLWGYPRHVVTAAAVVSVFSLQVAPLWFGAQWTFNLSLARTSVASNTILSSTSSLFTYGVALVVLGEAWALPKVAGILACILGTALVTLADSEGAPGGRAGSVGGDLLVLLSALCYALYTTAIRAFLPGDDSRTVMQLFGLVGAMGACALAPVLLFSQLTGLLDVLAPALPVYGLVVLKGLLDNVLSDYLWARAVLLIGPTLATVGMSVQVPLAVGGDALFRDPAWLHSGAVALWTGLGAALVLAGFLGATLCSPPDPKGDPLGGEAHEGAEKARAEGEEGRRLRPVRLQEP